MKLDLQTMLAGVGLVAALAYGGPAVAGAERAAASSVRAAIGTTFDKPGEKVLTDPVVVVGDHAVAGWTQGERGGRALLRRQGKAWEIVLCAGKALSEAGFLKQSGVPQATAERLARELARAESAVPAELRARFDAFDPAAAASAHAGHSAASSHSIPPAGKTPGASHPHH